MDLNKWGVQTSTRSLSDYWISKPNSPSVYHVVKQDVTLNVDLTLNEKSLLTFKDTMSPDLHNFTRTMNNKTYYYVNNVLTLTLINPPLKGVNNPKYYIGTIEKDLFRGYKFITMDLETRELTVPKLGSGSMVHSSSTGPLNTTESNTQHGTDTILEVTTISIYDGTKVWSYFLSDYANPDQMMQTALKSLMFRKYHGYRLYLHNFSQFDSVFLLKNIVHLSNKVKPFPALAGVLKQGDFP